MKLAGPTFAIIIVLAFPPNDYWSNLVSFESLYGICVVVLLVRDPITCPKTERAELIYIPYLDLPPVACVFFCLYEPAKSTKFNLPALILD